MILSINSEGNFEWQRQADTPPPLLLVYPEQLVMEVGP